ncbi:Hypothetical protein CINCED_3A024342 [Cinara cedri]|uniref:Transcriptional coactivator p15 (PC4) C-terminal domain-containing protein n=1 Tax=Cinara cedri TaxID=506608 RepID=A0A5E4NR11_9HEMI|nr:Hypothetical protein CINCED_3A024342 [Cinara cedri]
MAPKNSKRNASDDSSSDSDGPLDRNPPPKKSKPAVAKKSNQDEVSFELDKNRFVKVREFKGKLFVDIREFYEKNGELCPGKKGMPNCFYTKNTNIN